MKYQYWLGTEDALMALIDTEKMAAANFVAMMDRRKAFLDEYDDADGMPNMGDYLIHRQGNGSAVVKVSGSLTNGYKWYHEFLDGAVTSYEAIGDALSTLEADESVDNIVLSIHSGGGAVTGIDALGEKIRKVDRSKPVRAHTQTAAFSAAYWIATSAREVVTTRMAEVGSIGTLMVHQSIARFAEEKGVDFTVFRAGKYKALGLPYEELTDEVKAHLQADIEKANQFFLEHVSRRRNLMVSEQHRWADGKTFFAGEAKDVGLVDRIASLEEVVSASGASHHRSRIMFISDEKRAQIAAGARPEDVLSDKELEQYKTDLEAADKGGEGEGAQAGEEGTEGVQDGEEEAAGKEANEGEESSGQGADLSVELRQALRDNGKLEARAEVAENRVAELDQQLGTQRSQMESLQEIGKLAVNNLQVAVGMPKESAATPEGLVSMYNDLQKKMAARFSTGRQSQGESHEHDVQADIPLAFRTRK